MAQKLQKPEKGQLAEALESYLAFLQLERGASPRTISSYQSDLQQLLAFFSSRNISSVSQLSHSVISAFLAELTSQKVRVGRPSINSEHVVKSSGFSGASTIGLHTLSVASASRKITSLRTFLKFLFAENLIAEDLAERVSVPRQKRKLPHTLTLAQYEKLLSSVSEGTPAGLRDRALIELMFSSGLRVSEVISLKLTDLDEEAEFLRVFGKGSKERVVPVGQAALNALKKYLEGGRKSLVTGKTTGALFISSRGTALSRITVWLMLKNTAVRAGIPPSLVKPHGLRHSFATELLKGGADLRLIQGLLGHSSIATTQIYTAVEPSHLIETHEKFHPRSGMKI